LEKFITNAKLDVGLVLNCEFSTGIGKNIRGYTFDNVGREFSDRIGGTICKIEERNG